MKKGLLVVIAFALIFVSIVFALTVASFVVLLNSQEQDKTALNNFLDNNSPDKTQEPKIKLTTIVDGLTNPWEASFVNKDFFYYTQRSGDIRAHNLQTNEDFLLLSTDANVENEGGLLGLAVDNDFAKTHYLFACMNVSENEAKRIILVRYVISTDLKDIESEKIIINDMPSNDSQRHSGCRVQISKQGEIWIGTGDTAIGTVPQDPMSLGGKILRVDKDGKGVSGNLTTPFDPRIFSYGHRNTQGITLFDKPMNGVYGLSGEHGPDKDDEVNLLKSGNFGWDPISDIPEDYNEAVQMTDTDKFPDAIPSIWASGEPTNAISGMTIIKGDRWKAWDGAYMVAVLKDKQIRLQTYDTSWNIVRDDVLLQNQYGRIRTVVQGLDGNLYLLTDNGNNDVIVQISPE